MPRHPPTEPTEYAERQTLVAELAQELQKPRHFGQPIILEKLATGTQSVITDVIWDRWEGCPSELRADIILDAYEKALGAEYRDKISLAIGITVPEAAAMGMLPYWVSPMGRTREALSEKELQAIIEAGGSRMSTSRMPEVPWLPGVRCATLEDAVATLGHLQDILPDSKWMIAQEVYPPDAPGQ
jgi:hypothetical protein